MRADSQTREFKQTWKHYYLKTICSFANGNGVNTGVRKVLELIRKNQAANASAIVAQYPQASQKTIECWLKTLSEQSSEARLRRMAASQQKTNHA